MPTTKAPDGSTWKKIEEDRLSGEEIDVWKNDNGDEVILEHDGQTNESKVPESQWVGSPAQTTTGGDKSYKVTYPDGVVTDGHTNLENTRSKIRKWIKKNPDQSGDYVAL